MLSFEALIAGTSRCRTRAAAATSLAGIFYTGGTTGHRPRASMLSHANLLVSALGMAATGAF